ncbi:hypothetical protein FA13DRAFT_1805897 [Coprinellus micaceus]|uniref:Uncharacterized protein n=1 Tax=Coprinellus micaceus TaxID=71717 RepID=A0A4Y7RVV8_COPMI|nr:hypothetical protein FA13DRAFT_1805897 [Coprinellus micaceus]
MSSNNATDFQSTFPDKDRSDAKEFATETTTDIIHAEAQASWATSQATGREGCECGGGDKVEGGGDNLDDEVKCTGLWRMLNECLATNTSVQKERGKVIMTIISILCYRARIIPTSFPKSSPSILNSAVSLLGGFDMLHALGLVMSYNWA